MLVERSKDQLLLSVRGEECFEKSLCSLACCSLLSRAGVYGFVSACVCMSACVRMSFAGWFSALNGWLLRASYKDFEPQPKTFFQVLMHFASGICHRYTTPGADICCEMHAKLPSDVTSVVFWRLRSDWPEWLHAKDQTYRFRVSVLRVMRKSFSGKTTNFRQWVEIAFI